MKSITLSASAVAFLLMLPSLSSADPWKDGPGNGRGHYERDHHEHKHKKKHKHKHKEKHDKEVIYVYEERPREEVVYVYKERPRETVVYIEEERPRVEVVYTPEPRPREVVHTPAESPREKSTEVRSVTSDIEQGTCNRSAVGSVLGGVVGGVVGYQVGRHNGDKGVGMVVGAIAGAVVGNQIGKNMDGADVQCTAQTLEHAQDGQTVNWRNPENGVDYAMTPLDSYRKNDLECRRYVAVASSDTNTEELTREACKQPDGRWEVSDLKARL